jgi:tRNA U34 5-methylaminomethyl-2-thiouridine-forming methyltransferase MnmC
LKTQLITTKDGSKTIHFPEWNESYHSKHGAITEALHVYIKSGLTYLLNANPNKKHFSILEMGFGTGLNAYLTYNYGQELNLEITYTCIEKYPLSEEVVEELNYADGKNPQLFKNLHAAPWEEFVSISDNFKLKKHNIDIDIYQSEDNFDVIYFDAFGPRVQPKLWRSSILKTMYDSLNPNGVWVTYCCKGSVRRDLMDIGFQVEKIPGPPGKREMLRAIKVQKNI